MSFFFNDTATTQLYTLSLHDALPISRPSSVSAAATSSPPSRPEPPTAPAGAVVVVRSEEHTSELQSQSNLVCRLLLEKKNFNENAERSGKRRYLGQYYLLHLIPPWPRARRPQP